MNVDDNEEYDDFCNVGEKHSTFLFAYAADFDVSTFNQMTQLVIQSVTANRHNYTKLAIARFDTNGAQDAITYYDDIQPFSAALTKNPPNPNSAASPSTPSNVLPIISSFLSASGRPLESSMVVLLLNRFPALNADLSSTEYDTITNNNVKIFPIISDTSYATQHSMVSRSSNALTSISANSNSHFMIGKVGSSLVQTFQYLMNTAYLDSLAATRSFVDNFGFAQNTIGKLRVPHSETSSYVNFTITISAQTLQNTTTNTNGLSLVFYQSPNSQQIVKFEPGSLSNTNFYYATVQLKQGTTYQVQYKSQFDLGTITMIRVWTESVLYHYGSYASLDDPMGGVTLDKVDEYQGAALRMKLMNDCYTTHAAYVLFTDCNGAVSAKYDSSQTIDIDYIFADEGSFPHYPIVPFFCDNTPIVTSNCVPGSESKYDIQFVAGEFTVIRSFQCRPGVGQIKSNCRNKDVNGNYYCNREKLPYMRGPTGQIPDCLGHGHVEYDFANAEAYICVCDDGYSGDSCEKH
ncbi:hypothetical protein L5515_010051 [Caenorhabditis briggsae]|uniref:EGF-like domain-containing protein n=2 Tax=Caenorhabditis briggsae TaxID=6238 RepID=A0AAE9ESJ7_CAEBR|nr:hypothetical protein L5515_010051 [Caenorhabditis briggsae]